MNKVNRPKRHHYVTRSYLENFCVSFKKKKTFWAYDKKRQLWRKSQPLNEAVELDFQKLDHFIGLDPYYLEKALGEIEGSAVDVIRQIAINKSIPPSLKEFSPVINLMGIFAGRSPLIREMLILDHQRRILAILEAVHENEDIFHAQVGKVLEDNSIEWPLFNSYQDSKSFLKSKKFKIQIDPSIIVEEMTKIASQAINVLGFQNWMLLESREAEFITSNNPVNVILALGFIPYFLGFGRPNTLVTFPITPNLALLGSYSPLPNHRKVDSLIVEGVNWMTTNRGATTLYTKKKSSLPSFEGIIHLQDFHRLLSTRLIE